MNRTGKLLTILFLFLSGLCPGQLPVLTLQTGHTDEITVLEFSDDGNYLASGGKDNTVVIWDFNMGKQIKRLAGHSGAISCIKFFRDGLKLATGGRDGKIIIWDLLSERIIRTYSPGLNSEIVSFDISADETKIVLCGTPDILKIWYIGDDSESEADEIIRSSGMYPVFRSDPTPYISVGFSRNGKEMAICKGGGLYFFSLSEGTADRYIRQKPVRSLGFLMRKERAGRYYDWVWCDENNENIIFSDKVVRRKSGRTNSNVFSDIVKSNTLLNREEFTRSSDYSKYRFTAGSVNSDLSLVAAANEDNNIYLWNYENGIRYPGIKSSGTTNFLAFHPSRSNIMVSTSDRDIIVWDVSEKENIRTLSSKTYPVTAISVNEMENRIVMAATDNSVKILSLDENINVTSLGSHNSNFTGLGFTGADQVVAVGLDNTMKFIDPSGGSQGSIRGNSNPAIFNAFLHLPFLSAFANSFTSFIFTKNFLVRDSERLYTADFSDDNKLLAAGGTGFRSGFFYNFLYPRMIPVHVVNNELHRKSLSLPGHYISVDALSFNRDASLLASVGQDYTGKTAGLALKREESGNSSSPLRNYDEINSVKIWDIDRGKLLSAFENEHPVSSIEFASLNDTLLFADSEKNVVIFDYKQNLSTKIRQGMGPLLFLNSDRDFLCQDIDYSINICDLSTGLVTSKLPGHSDLVTCAATLQSGSRLLTAGWDGALKLWDLNEGKEIVTFFTLNEDDYLVKTPENYYYATKNAVREIGFTSGMNFYPFEQFDLKYNRPDIVLARIGNSSPELIAAYHRAYIKRISKLGFTEEMLSADFHTPGINIENRNEIQTETEDGNIRLIIKATDTRYPLDRINVWINDVAIFGKSGIDQRSPESMSVYDTITVQLASGLNKIQVSALNRKGAESLREIIEVSYKAPGKEPDLYLISLGVSEFRDSRFNLNYASKDAADIADLFKRDTVLFRNIYTLSLTDENVTADKLSEIRAFAERASRDDVVLLFIAGHGLLDSNLDYYFGTWDMDFNNPSGRGIIFEDIENLFDGLTALKKVLFMDTCFSGEVDKDEVELAQATNTEYGSVTFRNAGTGVRAKQAFGARNTSELMKELFTDIRKGTGSTIISSAGGAEFALEGEQWKNGLFTFCLLNGINEKAADSNNDGQIMLSEIQEYVRVTVPLLSGGRQMPDSRTTNLSLDFRLW